MNWKKVFQYSISVILAGILLYWVFKDFNFDNLWESFKNANYYWVLISALIGLVAHYSRAYRWSLMLKPLGYNISVFKGFLAVLIGYFTNLALPRAGEFARAASLQKQEDVPFEKSFGTIVAERVIDVLMLLFLLCINLALEYQRISSLLFEILGTKFKDPFYLIKVVLIGVFVLFILFYIFKKYRHLLQKKPWYKKIESLFEGLWQGFSSIFQLNKPWVFLSNTFFIWLCYYLMTYALCLAITNVPPISPLACFSILTMGALGMAAPTIGGLGSYHILVGKIVSLYGLTEQEGITLATFLHSMQGIVFVVIYGVIALLLSFNNSKSDKKDAKMSK